MTPTSLICSWRSPQQPRWRCRGAVSIGVAVTDQRKQTSCRLPAPKRVAHSKIVCSQRSACQIRQSRSGGDGDGVLRRLRLIGYCHASVLIRPKRKRSSSLLLKRVSAWFIWNKGAHCVAAPLRALPSDRHFLLYLTGLTNMCEVTPPPQSYYFIIYVQNRHIL